MKTMRTLFILLLIAIVSCNTKNNKPASYKLQADTTKYYPIEQFIREQIQYVDLRNFTIYQVTQKDNKTDSVILSKDAFIDWANKVLAMGLYAETMAGHYKESVFNDQTTGSITLHYAKVEASSGIQYVDVLLDASGTQVKRLFLKALTVQNDTTITEQLSWKANKSAVLSNSATTTNGYQNNSTQLITWNEIQK